MPSSTSGTATRAGSTRDSRRATTSATCAAPRSPTPTAIAEFTTIYPGWYRGRTVHIHAKVHLDKQTVLTTQLFFDEAVTEQVYKRTPYSEHTGRDMFNDQDGIFDDRRW